MPTREACIAAAADCIAEAVLLRDSLTVEEAATRRPHLDRPVHPGT